MRASHQRACGPVAQLAAGAAGYESRRGFGQNLIVGAGSVASGVGVSAREAEVLAAVEARLGPLRRQLLGAHRGNQPPSHRRS